AGVLTFSGITHQYLDNPASGNYPVTVTVTDKDGASATASSATTVLNVAPSGLGLTLSAAVINQGGSTSLSRAFTDPGTQDTHAVVINWGDGSQTTLNLAAGVLTFSGASHAYTGAAGNYAISATVTDKDQGSVTGTTSVQVTGTVVTGGITGP